MKYGLDKDTIEPLKEGISIKKDIILSRLPELKDLDLKLKIP